MRIQCLRLENFRNIQFTQLGAGSAQRIFLNGANAQGKTSVLEAVNLLGALRSFRTSVLASCIRQGAEPAQARVYMEVEMDTAQGRGEIEAVLVTLGARSRSVSVGGQRIQKLQQLVGRYPVVALAGDDLQILRGAPSVRRKWLDALLARSSAPYMAALQVYQRVLKQRNSALKRGASVAELGAFSAPFAQAAAQLHTLRAQALPALQQHVAAAYSVVCLGAPEAPHITYAPHGNEPLESAEAVLAALAAASAKERALKVTALGPHKDDVEISLNNNPAKLYASEGQQRGLVLALRLAEFAHLKSTHPTGETPIVLADDVLGQLDPARQAAFWQAIGPSTQVLATGTVVPACAGEANPWQVWEVHAGQLTQQV